MHFRISLILTLLASGIQASAKEEEKWQTLFNGKDLSGWRANLLPDSFTVENGAIKSHCQDPDDRKSHLFYVGNLEEGFVRFKDFELELMARSEPNSNSGIFFHTDMTVRDEKEHLRNGYEVQMNNKPKPAGQTGSLYSIVDFEESIVDETNWYHVRIKVVKKRIQVFINDRRIVDYTEPLNPEREPNRVGRLLNPQGGAIALQGHDSGSIYYFKEIRIRRLD